MTQPLSKTSIWFTGDPKRPIEEWTPTDPPPKPSRAIADTPYLRTLRDAEKYQRRCENEKRRRRKRTETQDERAARHRREFEASGEVNKTKWAKWRADQKDETVAWEAIRSDLKVR